MDWSRAKSIILVLLLSLNIFLFINIVFVKTSFENSREYRLNAQQAMAESGLEINCSIPSSKPIQRISFVEKDKNVYTEMIRMLMGVTDENEVKIEDDHYCNDNKELIFSDNEFIFTDKTGSFSVPTDTKKGMDIALRTWIRKNRISKESFVLDSLYEADDIVIAEYVQLYKKRPIFNNKITFIIENKTLVKVEGSLRIFYYLKANKEDETVPAEIVLLTNKDMINDTVVSIDLGYFLTQSDELYDTAVWRVKLASGEDLLFNAFTGDWIGRR